MKRNYLIYTVLFLAAFAFSCSSDDGPGVLPDPDPISLSDANALSEAIIVAGAERLEGTPPAPTGGPTIDVFSDQVSAIEGRTLDLRFEYSETSAPVEGVYLRIKDAADYLKIPFDKLNTGGRLGDPNSKPGRLKIKNGRSSHEEVEVPIDLPSNLGSGTFCVEYCLYDAATGISDIVETCIEIIQEGPIDINFLTANDPWVATSVTDLIYGDFDEVIAGEVTDIPFYAHCPFNQDSVLIESQIRLDLFRLVFNDDNTFSEEIAAWTRDLNYDVFDNGCEVVYDEETIQESDSGTWAYNADEFILTTHLVDAYDGYEYDWNYTLVSLTANKMEIMDEDGYKWVMVPE